jgi:hypothetical protein
VAGVERKMGRMRRFLVMTVAIAAVLAACESLQPAGPLEPKDVPMVRFGFEGEGSEFPWPGGISSVLLRARATDPSGSNARAWAMAPELREDAMAGATGVAMGTDEARFGYSVGERVLTAIAASATSSYSPVVVTAGPQFAVITIDRTRSAGPTAWIEVTLVFDDEIDGQPARIDATYGFMLHLG